MHKNIKVAGIIFVVPKKSKRMNTSQKTETNISLSRRGICPFVETPGTERELESVRTQPQDPEATTGAAELFSLFTADIIKEDVLFTR